CDAPRKRLDLDETRCARSAAASGSAGALTARRVGRRRRGRGRRRRRGRSFVPAADYRAAPVGDVEHGLLAVVAPHFPVHERGVVRGFLAIVGGLDREVIQTNSLPSRRLEWRLRRIRVALGRAGARSAALALSEERRRARQRRESRTQPERVQQLTSRQLAAIEPFQDLCRVLTHFDLLVTGNWQLATVPSARG